MVLNLAAGLDSRPYRMPLPKQFRWVEVDLPEILDYKQEILKNDKPLCALESIRLDLSDVAARRKLFEQLGAQAKNVLVLTEGLLIYLNADEVGGLAEDVARPNNFHYWLIDLVSPGLLKMLQETLGQKLSAAGRAAEVRAERGTEFLPPLWLEAKRYPINY